MLLKISDVGSYPIAKIADFGNSRIMSTTDPTLQLESLSRLPGTLIYLPPEAHSGHYNDKLDIFSFGHMSLFVCTQTFRYLLPVKYLANRADGTEQWLARSEVERRKEYFAELHDIYTQYRPLMLECLEDGAHKRPSAKEVVRELERIRSTLISMDDVVDSPVEANDNNVHSAAPAGSEHAVWLQDSGEAKIDIN